MLTRLLASISFRRHLPGYLPGQNYPEVIE
jgi:hypothetical protein